MGSRSKAVISLFSGAMGLDLGLEQAGFEIRVAVEPNRFAAETIRRNRPSVAVIEKRLEEATTKEILKAAQLEPGEAAVVTGGPSCQSFSTAGRRGSINDPRGAIFREFLRVVRQAKPRFFIMENVKGLLSAAVRHRPLAKRGPGFPPLARDEELGSALIEIIKSLRRTRYYVVFDLLNAADYGVAQVRERLVFIGSRDGEPIVMPEPTHAREPENGERPWVTLREALKGVRSYKNSYTGFCRSKEKLLRHVPSGGNWRDLPPRLQAQALGRAYLSWGGRVGFFRRLAWGRPAPSLTSRPDSKATMLAHPRSRRPLSVKEYKRLQQFPDDWQLDGGLPQQYLQAGNAVPVGLARAIGRAVLGAMRRRTSVDHPAVVCASEELLDRITARPRAILNPRRMRKVKGSEATVRWLGEDRRRDRILKYVDLPDD